MVRRSQPAIEGPAFPIFWSMRGRGVSGSLSRAPRTGYRAGETSPARLVRTPRQPRSRTPLQLWNSPRERRYFEGERRRSATEAERAFREEEGERRLAMGEEAECAIIAELFPDPVDAALVRQAPRAVRAPTQRVEYWKGAVQAAQREEELARIRGARRRLAGSRQPAHRLLWEAQRIARLEKKGTLQADQEAVGSGERFESSEGPRRRHGIRRAMAIPLPESLPRRCITWGEARLRQAAAEQAESPAQ